MKTIVRRLVPLRLLQWAAAWKERRELAAIDRLSCDVSGLGRLDGARLHEMFSSSDLAEEWNEVEPIAAALAITDRADGVNLGDRRAVFYLLRSVGALSVLEIGTHIGASTVHIGLALTRNAAARGTAPRMVTVDIVDVNDETKQPWRALGSKESPRQMVTKLGMASWIEFVTEPSLAYLAKCRSRFDFIFLDGNHAARTVYREIPAALRLLNPGGAILLHDYFPHMQPLWDNGVVIPGPWLACERFRAEGASFEATPLGELAWATKLGSKHTSLAVVARRQRA